MCWTRPLEGEDPAAAAAARAATDERGVEAREGTRRGAGEDEDEDEEEGAIEWTIDEGGVVDGDEERRRRRCGASGAAVGAGFPWNGQAPVATFARRGVGLSLRAI